jgi:signal transduction histidine kinase
LADAGVATQVRVQPEAGALTPEAESLLFRASQEAIRNVISHARAHNVRVDVNVRDLTAVLEVEDDGIGFSPTAEAAARADGHLGLQVLGDLAHDAGGTLNVTSTPGAGTRIRLEVPVG